MPPDEQPDKSPSDRQSSFLKAQQDSGNTANDAKTLNCPMCGAPAATDATSCEHCGARLATVACPSCFGLIFLGAKFCSHCGAKIERTETAPQTKLSCPRCHVPMEAVKVGNSNLTECSKCEGLWIDNGTFLQICQDREKQVAVLGLPITVGEPGAENRPLEVVHYMPCPICKNLMNRVQFGQCSHVIVDVCTKHGTWFDKDELRKIIEFIRSGGLDKTRAREIQELEQRGQFHEVDTIGSGLGPDYYFKPARFDGYDLAMDALSAAFQLLLK